MGGGDSGFIENTLEKEMLTIQRWVIICSFGNLPTANNDLYLLNVFIFLFYEHHMDKCINIGAHISSPTSEVA